MKQNAKSAIFTRENGKRLLRQLLLLLPAWIVLALGIAMSVFSGVGSDTNTSFQQGLGRMLGLQTGTVTLIFNWHRSRDFHLRKSLPCGPRLPCHRLRPRAAAEPVP